MAINKIIDNYLVFVVIAIFGFIVFWYSLVKEDYFTVVMALLLLFISQFKIKSICHNKNKGKTGDKEHHKKHEHLKHKDKLYHRIKHHITHHAKKVGELQMFTKLKDMFASMLFRLPQQKKVSQSIVSQKLVKNSLNETFLDDMYTQVQDAGQITISQLASRYGLSIGMLEKFAKVLDKEKLVELYYPAIGMPVVRKLNYIAELNAKKIANSSGTLNDANKKQKIINLALFGILVFTMIMIGYLIYLNKFAAQ